MHESKSWGLRRNVLGAAAMLVAAGCSSKAPSDSQPHAPGDSDFVSVAPGGGQGRGLSDTAGPSADAATTGNGASATPRTVEETDIYRLEGDRLYFLNGYRGLMVFDVSDVDHPRFLGRSPIYGDPVEMTVHGGVANVVVSDWYGKMDDGTPFHGSIVRGIDATDPANMRITGEAKLGGTVRDTRVVGEVIYAVTERYSWDYGWYGVADSATRTGGAATSAATGAKVSVSAVSFAGNVVRQVDSYEVPGENGIFNVTPDSILLASAEVGTPDQYGYAPPTGNSRLTYVDISDPGGSIAVRGQLSFPGYLFGYGTDNGRWNLDFADGATAHLLACGEAYCSSGRDLTLATADFTDPDHPLLVSRVGIPANTWSPAVRFDANRMYLSPAGDYYYGPDGAQSTSTPIQIFDLANPAAPTLKGTVDVTGQIWNFTPSGDRLFALGNQYNPASDGYGSSVVLHYLDVADAAAPKALGKAAFGQGWAWTPAAGTFKAFTKNDQEKLVVLPFSGYSTKDNAYNNGLQLIEFTPTSITTGAAAKTRGWVERGIFVKNRLVSLSDLSLSVVDYANRAAPAVVAELTLARNVVDAKPQGDGTVAELSSDWWGNGVNVAELRVLDAANVDETRTDATLSRLELEGTNARVFHDGSLSYVATQVSRRGACPADTSSGAPKPGGGTQTDCEFWHTRVQVVDRSGDQPVLRGRADLPESMNGWGWGWGWGWFGCYLGDWYFGSQFVQVGGDVLAMQTYEPNATGSGWHQVLTTVNLQNPDAPVIGSTAITQNLDDWWGNMRAVGDQLYVNHYEWLERPTYNGSVSHPGSVRFFIDRIDLSVPASPQIGARINVPGVLVGASASDPNLIYTIDYRWYEDRGRNLLAVSRIDGNKAYYQGGVEIPGYVGNVIVTGSNATFTVQEQTGPQNDPKYVLKLYQASLADPLHPTLRASTPAAGWGWLLDVQGDRAFVTSGFGDQGIDVFKLSDAAAPAFDQFVRVRGWYPGALSRENDDVYFASGYWGTERVTLK